MCSCFLLFILCALGSSLNAFIIWETNNTEADNTLKLVHVLFRHGNRNPDQSSLYPGDPYYSESYYPDGYGQLINVGKRTEFQLGRSLRKRYDAFLGPLWNINMLDVRATNVNRTKMSAQLMLAGLFPPRFNQTWSFLLWQPIPYNYLPVDFDKELEPSSACSTKYNTLLTEVLNTPEISEYIQRRYGTTLEILSKNIGEKTTFLKAEDYYFGMLVQDQLGFKLPEWTKAVYPEPLRSLAVDFYYIVTNNTALRRIMAGYLIKKVLADTKSKMRRTLSPSGRKMFIYSAHEFNVASLLLSLDAFEIASVPNYGAYVLLEVHKVNGVYGLKLFYQNYETNNPIPLRLPGCDYFCPYHDFCSLVDEILPESDEDCYGT